MNIKKRISNNKLKTIVNIGIPLSCICFIIGYPIIGIITLGISNIFLANKLLDLTQ